MIDNNSVLVSIFFAASIALYQYLHCYYVSKDPVCKGELGVGWPVINSGIIQLDNSKPLLKNYGVQSAFTLFVSGFFISLVVSNSIFMFKEITNLEIFLAVTALLSVAALSQVMGAGWYKGFLAIILIIQIGIVWYILTGNFEGSYIFAAMGVLATMTTGFAGFWMHSMLSRLTKKQRGENVYILGLYSAVSPSITWIMWLVLLYLVWL
ncbi:MAG: hypothetical protein MUO82_10060 [Candidatus Thermoplasmatota archaeon]|nr:hypothetical protein [Candidatus Thermoplasmatota archaeon]